MGGACARFGFAGGRKGVKPLAASFECSESRARSCRGRDREGSEGIGRDQKGIKKLRELRALLMEGHGRSVGGHGRSVEGHGRSVEGRGRSVEGRGKSVEGRERLRERALLDDLALGHREEVRLRTVRLGGGDRVAEPRAIAHAQRHGGLVAEPVRRDEAHL